MPDTLVITVHLEHLESIPAPNLPRDRFYFGVNLSTALDSGAAPIPTWARGTNLAPRFQRLGVWHWTNLTPRVFVWKRGQPLDQAVPVGHVVEQSDFVFDGLAGPVIENYVRTRANKVPDGVPDPFYLNIATTIVGGDEYAVEEQEAMDFFAWPPFLKGVSTLPAEVTYRNNLTHLIEIAEADLVAAGINVATDVFAVFVCFDATIDAVPMTFPNLPALLNPPPLDPMGEASFTADKYFPQTQSFKLDEQNGNATTVIQPVVLQNRASLPPKAPSIQDTDTLWVELTVDADGHDQASQTLQDLTRAFDPAQHLVNLLHAVPSSGPAFTLAQRGTFVLSRELAHLGFFPSGRYSLVEEVAAQISRGAALTVFLQNYETANFQTFDRFASEWGAVLAAAAPQLAGIQSRLLAATDSYELLSALEIFTAQLSDPEVLNAIVVQQWQRAGIEPGILAEALPILGDALSNKAIRTRYQEQWLQEQIPALAQALGGTTTFDSAVADALHAQMKTRLTSMTAGDVTPPPLPGLLDQLITSSKDLLKKIAEQARSGGGTTDDRRSGTEDAQPVIFRVDDGKYDTDSKALEDDDLQRRIAGVGILMREQGQDWRCLHVARLGLTGATELIAQNVISPSNLSFLAGQRQTTLFYDNEPLAAHSNMTGFTNTQQQEKPPGILSWIEPRLPDPGSGVPLTEFLTPALVFGRWYDAAAFLVTNSGQLPRGLTDGAWTRRITFPQPAASIVPPHVASFPYLRRTRIGAPRLADENLYANDGKKTLASYPAGVRPLATELFVPGSVDVPLVDDKTHPLLLLGDSTYGFQEDFTFRLRRPSTPRKVWERWRRADDPAYPFGVLNGGILALMDNQFDARGQKLSVDSSVDDPAVESKLYVAFSQVFPVPAPGTPALEYLIDTAAVTMPAAFDSWSTFLTALSKEQYISDVITVVTSAAGPTGYVEATRTFTVKEGEIWRIEVYSVVAEKFLTPSSPDQRFDDWFTTVENPPLRLNAARKKVTGVQPVKFYAFSPWTLIVEAAAFTLPDSQALWDHLALNFDYTASELSVQVNRVGLGPEWARIGSVDLQRQQWKWHGRPTPAPPAVIADNAANVRWEVSSYALRSDDDYTIESIALPYEQGQTTGLRTLKTVPLADDTRALHFRWSMKVWSRYTPKPAQWNNVVAASRQWAVAQAVDLVPGTALSRLGMWKRILPKCRQPQEDPVAPPPLKICVPITGSWNDGGDDIMTSPGLLAICYGEWFETYGLLEEFEVGIRAVKHPQLDRWYLQYGADPVLQNHALNVVKKGKVDAVEGEADERIYILPAGAVEPALGHISDRLSVPDPRVLNTSFIVRVPTIPAAIFESIPSPAADEIAAGWRFVQLRFRRRLPAALRADGVDRTSPWSPPQWVQLLHSRDALLPRPKADFDQQQLTIKISGGKLTLSRNGTQLPCPRVYTRRLGQPEENRFAYWLLVTRLIVDNARHEGEAYYTVLELDNIGVNPAPPAVYKPLLPNLTSEPGRYRVRFLELQTRDAQGDLQAALAALRAAQPPGQPWDVLFPKDEAQKDCEQDAIARISSISPPLDFEIG